MASYNVTRFTRQVLKRHRKEPPSLVLHLYPTHFRFEQQHGNFNYDSPMKCFLEAIREQKLPTDLLDVLDEAGVRYYEGCLIVEVHDHRSAPQPPALTRPGLSLSFQLNHPRDAPPASKAEVYRIVLCPNPATLWTEIGLMDRKWQGEKEEEDAVGLTEEEAVEIEAMILARTAPPLCLSPSLQTTRLANTMLRATTLRPPKRKRSSNFAEGDEDEEGEEANRREREEHERLMKIGDEGVGRGRGHAFARLAFIQAYRERQSNPNPLPIPVAPASTPSGIISLRLGGPSLQSGGSTPGGNAGSPPRANSVSSQQARPKKKISMGGATESDGTPGPSGTKKLSKKAQAAAQAAALANGSQSLDPLDPSLPDDPVEKERVLVERKRLIGIKKRAEAKQKQKDKKKQIEAMQLTHGMTPFPGDLQVGGMGGLGNGQARPGLPGPGGPPMAKFAWAAGGQ